MRYLFCLLFSLICANVVHADAAENYRYAVILLSERQDFAAAAEKFNEFAVNNPRHQDAPQALFYLATCYNKLQKEQSAAESYEKLARLYPQNELAISALAFGADAYFRSRLYHQAIALYDELGKKFPAAELAITAPYWRAQAYLRLAKEANDKKTSDDFYQQAQNDFEHFSTSKHQLVAEAIYRAGLAAFEQTDYARSVKKLTRLLEEFPNFAQSETAIYQLAESYYWLENYASASKYFSLLQEKFANGKYQTQTLSGLGWCAYMQKDFCGAGEKFAQMARGLTDVEKSADAHFAAGVAFEENGDAKKSLQEFALAQKSAKHASKTLLRMAGINRELAQKSPTKAAEYLTQAENNLAQAVEIADENFGAQAAALLGEVRLDLQNYAGAVLAFQAGLEKWSESRFAAFSWYHQALALSHEQKYDLAANCLRELLQNFPQSNFRLPAAYLMADCQKALGNVDRARLAWLWLVNEAPTWLENYRGENMASVKTQAHDLIIRAMLHLGESYYAFDGAKAAEYFARVQDDYADDPRGAMANIRVGEIAEKQKNYGAAKNAYQQALATAQSFTTPTTELTAVCLHAEYRLGVLEVLSAPTITDEKNRRQTLQNAIKQLTAFRKKYAANIVADLWVNRAQYYLAEALYGLNKKDEAAKYYEQCYQTAPNDILADAALCGLGWWARENQQWETAEKNWQCLIDNFPRSEYLPEALYWLCVQKQTTQNYDQALYLAQRLQNEFPANNERATVEIAKIYTATNKSADAEKMLREFLTATIETPERARALQALSTAYWQLAEPLFAQATREERDLKQFLGGKKIRELSGEPHEQATEKRSAWLAVLSKAREIENQMIAALTTLVNDYPDFGGRGAAYLRLGEAFFERSEWEIAKQHYCHAIATNDKNISDKAHYRLAWCYWRLSEQNDEPTQIAHWRQLATDEFIKVSTDFASSPLAMESVWQAAEILRENNDAPTALTLYLRAQKSTENIERKLSSIYGAALCFLELKKYREAYDAYKNYLQNRPQNYLPEANWGAGYAALMLGAYTEARDYFMNAKENNYGGEAAAKARYGLGLIEFEQGNWKIAREEFRKVEAFHGAWAEVAALALIKAAAASHELGDNDSANKDLQRVLEKYSNVSVVNQARELLSTIAK